MFNTSGQFIVSVITARGGSRGIPYKNIVLLAGRPLIDYTIRASIESHCIAETYVTSDCDRILAVSKDSGARLIKRPAEFATDTASSESAILHAIHQIQAEKGRLPEVFILLQPTSPLRNSQDIDKAVETFFQTKADALISGIEPAVNPLKQMLVGEDGMLRTLTDDLSVPFKARQLLPRAFQPNGAIYIIKTELFIKTGLLITDRTVPFYMDEIKSIDIDTSADLKRVEQLMLEMGSIVLDK